MQHGIRCLSSRLAGADRLTVKAYRLNKFLHQLIDAAADFLEGEEAACGQAGRDVNRGARPLAAWHDWQGLIRAGASSFMSEKPDAVVGVSQNNGACPGLIGARTGSWFDPSDYWVASCC